MVRRKENKMNIPLITVPEGSMCQEASMFSGNMYVPCGQPASTIVYHERDRRGYYMCSGCADHNVRNRGGKWVGGDKLSEYLRDVR
jgi:hypothetical protein